jgi:acyl-[acyl-carrier-protein]-phospholipid O-acyltransferase/long-chain-fatty-acid--[acyl-carrier-protein] ligase
VPLYAIIQDAAAPSQRARMVAANNIMNALFMVAGAAAAAGLAVAGLRPPAVLHVAALANLAVAVWIVRILPDPLYRPLLRWYFRVFHRLQVDGLENYLAAGDRVVIVANHQSYLDAPLLAAVLPDRPSFAIHTAQAARWYFKPFLAIVDTFQVNVQSPYAVKHMVEAVRDQGRKLMIFPEGRMTHTGALMKIYDGAAMVAEKAHAPIVPIAIEGLQYSRFNRLRGRRRQRWFPPVRVSIRPALTLPPPPDPPPPPRERRARNGRILQDAMVAALLSCKDPGRTLFTALLDARATHGRRMPIAEDIARVPASYDRLLLGAMALGRALGDATAGETHVGVLLPNAVGALAAFFALQGIGTVPCMLNVSAGPANILAACRAARARIVVSSRTFIARARLEKLAERLAAEVTFLWLEDLRDAIGLREKLRAWRDARGARRMPGALVSPDSAAVVLFTSGSEGSPKGVVLSHRNILTNCAQLESVVDFHSGDICFNALPMFHAFGLTGGTLLPLLSGVRSFYYPSPLHYRVVPALIYDTDATICFGTDTFLRGWAHYAHPYDFHAMRYIFAGAEKLRDDTRRIYADRFGVRILEGYGATETSPVLAVNTPMQSRPGAAGRLLPGITWRLQPVEGVDAGGRLQVRGPTVMLGYLHDSAPGVLEQMTDGWYDTGDIVTVDAAGFVAIVGRVKRFAKLGGEMLSMEAAEALAASVWPDARHAVIAVPDARKGEALLLVTTQPDAAVRPLLAHARAHGSSELLVPRALHVVAKLPLLATGKVDYPAVAAMVEADGAVAPHEAAAV